MKYLKLVISTFLLLAFTSVPAENLKQVFSDAIKNDPLYKSALAENRSLMENKRIALSLVLPNINFVGSITDNDVEPTNTGFKFNDSSQSNSYSLTLTQTIYNHDSFAQLSQADESVAIAKANFRKAKQDLMLRVASTYYRVLGSKDNLDFATAEKKSIEQQLHQTKQRFNVGLTAITDVHEAQSRYDQSVASEIIARNTLAISKERLREITGILYVDLKVLKVKTPLLSPIPANIDKWIATALNENIALYVAKKAMEISKQEILRAQSGYYPTLDFVATKSQISGNSSQTTIVQNDSTVLSIQLSYPLYEGGKTSSGSKKAKLAFQQAQELYVLQRRQTERETRNAYLTVIADISQVKALKQALASSKIALKATQAGFEVGTRTAVDVLNSQRELFRAQRNYSSSRYEYIIETLRLRLAAGTLNDADIDKINAWLVK